MNKTELGNRIVRFLFNYDKCMFFDRYGNYTDAVIRIVPDIENGYTKAIESTLMQVAFQDSGLPCYIAKTFLRELKEL